MKKVFLATIFGLLIGSLFAVIGQDEKIAFESNGTIFTVNPDGTGKAQLAIGGMPSFSFDGTKIVYRTSLSGTMQLWTMNADGTDQTQITNLPSTYQPAFPSFSPDGSRVVFSARPEASEREIFVMNVDGSGLHRITNDIFYDSDPSFSPDGTTILFIRFDSPGPRVYVMNALGENQTPLTSGDPGALICAYSPDGEKIAYSTQIGEIFEMNADGTGTHEITFGGFDPSYSPDGTKVVYRVSTGRLLADTTADPFDAVTFLDDGPAMFPSWGGVRPVLSPPPGKIVFTSTRDGNFEIYIMNSDGSNQTRLTDDPAFDFNPVLSPDGSKITFESSRDGNSEIYVMNVDGSGLVNLSNDPSADNSAAFSPDGTKIAFTSFRSGVADVYVMNADGTNPERLTYDGGFAPVFSPDGSKIAFTAYRDGNHEIYIMNADGTGQTNLTNTNAQELDPEFSPGGSKIAFRSDRDGNFEIYVINVDGSNPRNLTNDPAADFNPTFSPDGSKIAFHSSRNGNTDIYSMNFDGSGQIRLTDSASSDSVPFWGVSVPAPPDTTPPAIAAQVLGTLGTNGWYTSNVNVTWTVTDSESELGEQNGCNTQNVTADTAGITFTCSATSEGGSTSESITIKRDATAPVVSLNTRTPANNAGWNNTNVTLTWNCTDTLAGVTSSTIVHTVSAEGQNQSSTGTCQDNAGNSASDTQNGINIDKTAPILAPSVSPDPVFLGGTAAAAANASDSLSGVASSSCLTPVTSSVGSRTVACSALDNAGNLANANATYRVIYSFAGFFQPVENLPTINVATAGSSIPIKFSLSGNHGSNIFMPGSPVSGTVPCGSTELISNIDETVSAGSSSLTYEPSTDRYIYVWKTDKRWKGTCRQLMVVLADGNIYAANFRFK